MKNSCLSLLVLLGLALGVEIGGNGLTEKSNGNYELTLNSYGQTLTRLYVDCGESNASVYWDTNAVHTHKHMGETFNTKMINGRSYSSSNGYAYTMFGPMPSMVGQTVKVSVSGECGSDTIYITLK
mgnify:CR=1 FL=1